MNGPLYFKPIQVYTAQYNSVKQKSLAEWLWFLKWSSSNQTRDIKDDSKPRHKRPTPLQTLLLVGFIRINIGFQLARVTIEEHKVVAIDAMRFSTDH